MRLDPEPRTIREQQSSALIPHLRRGRLAVRSSYDLARAMGVKQRSLGFIVSHARRQGELIGSVHGEGYYLIETEDELDETMGHIESRKRGIDMTLAALTRAWADNQTESH